MTLYVLRYFPTLTETFVHAEIAALAREKGAGGVALAAFDRREGSGQAPPATLHQQPHRWSWLRWAPALVLEWVRAPRVDRVGGVRALWLAALLRRLRPERVHVHFAGEAAAWAMVACQRAGVSFAVTVHAVDLFKPHPLLDRVLHAAAEVVTISVYNQRMIRERHGIEARLERCRVEPAAVSSREPGRLLFVGRNVPKKGLALLIEAVAPLDGFTLDVVSDIASPGVPGVRVHGMLPHAEVLALIGEASALVLPCRRAADGDMDGIPVVLLEAMAAGVAVITTPISGIPEVVDESVGWLVPADDVEGLRAAVRAALADPVETARRGDAGRARARM